MLPRRSRGRQSVEAEAKYKEELEAFVQLVLQIQSRLDFKMGSRGWCYALEPHGLGKGDFDSAQRLINDCRKEGLLPLGFVAEEDARGFDCEEVVPDDETPEEYAKLIVESVAHAHKHYNPMSFWEGKPYFLQMLVEKIDLKSLFAPICDEYSIPIATTKGWSSISQREELIGRFKEHEDQGRWPVLLYCGDFDPAGLVISDYIKENLADLRKATGWTPDKLTVDRFGLNYDFIVKNNLTWIDNLETGSGQNLADPRHNDHRKPYVQDYLKQYGARKVEANAIVVVPEMGRDLCRAAINKYIPAAAVQDHRTRTQELQDEVAELVRALMNGG